MLYKKFSFKLLVRIGFIILNLLALSIIFGDDRLFFNQIILFIILIIQIYELVRFINYTNRELAKFLLSIKHNDFSVNFKGSKIGRSFEDLHDAMDGIIQTIENSKIEKEAQFHYLRLVVSNINIGIISIEDDENIVLMNRPAERTLGIEGINNWNILKEKSPRFTADIESIGDQGRKLIELQTNDDPFTLSVDVNSMKMLNKSYKLITFQDIRGEIEQKEIEAWHKLIRILTHEIMNSVTPISSLTETMESMLGSDGKTKKAAELDDETIEDLRFSLKTIHRRSDGMLSFIDDYRKLTKVAKPRLESVAISHLFESIQGLLKGEMDKAGIQFNVDIKEVDSIFLDAALVEQVLINLIKNSTHAVEGVDQPSIELNAYNEGKRTIIEVKDNGQGIGEKELREIFVPFFSTKKNGSGIGLSLSKQIMHLHGGQIKVKSEVGKGTSFYLVFKG
ncbi:HAMP domain-containing sensor histidine kinase [Fulvivirga sp.]|uniref:sensor histidine kinase n=1 Tax=Fulvivirga sp. TaxID=1931237 RepID=UPI0032EEE21C